MAISNSPPPDAPRDRTADPAPDGAPRAGEVTLGTVAPDEGRAPTRRKVTREEISARLADHKLWLESGKQQGAQFVSGADEDLSGANLLHANLSEANLFHANLSEADLTVANLGGANLFQANLSRANLFNANLSGADLSGANLRGANLPGANLSGGKLSLANLSGAHLVWANLSGADLRNADLSGANLIVATLEGADVHSAVLVGVRGLFGRGRATNLATVKGAEWATYALKRDFAHWAVLRFIGALHLFSASYIVFIGITVYAAAMRWLNEHVQHWHEWAGEHASGSAAEFAALVGRIPMLPVQQHFGLLLLAIGLLAVATTLHTFFCPEAIKEATETRWTRELNQPLIEYRSAMYSRRLIRYLTLGSFALGGLYTLGYLLWRAWQALSFLLFF